MEARVHLDGNTFTVSLRQEDGRWIADVDGESFPVRRHGHGLRSVVNVGDNVFSVDTRNPHAARIDGRNTPFSILSLTGVAGAPDPNAGAHGPMRPPMTGKLESIAVAEGQVVSQGDVLFVLEAMKMRNEIKAPADGVVGPIAAAPGDAVDTSTVVLTLEPPTSD